MQIKFKNKTEEVESQDVLVLANENGDKQYWYIFEVEGYIACAFEIKSGKIAFTVDDDMTVSSYSTLGEKFSNYELLEITGYYGGIKVEISTEEEQENE